jgi:hypothetical protein
MPVNFDYKANNTFNRVHASEDRYLFVRGSVGSGKSVGCVWHHVLNAMKQPAQHDGVRRSRYGILRATYPSLKSTTINTWKQWFDPVMKITYDSPIRARVQFPHPDGVSHVDMELVFIAIERENEVNKLQSLELTAAHMNEAHEMPQDVHQMLKSRINRYPSEKDGGCVDPYIICDYNSVPTDHWLYLLAEESKPQKHSFFVQPPALIMCPETDSGAIVKDLDENWYKVNPDADNLGHWEEGHHLRPPTAKSVWDDKVGQWWVPHLDVDYYVDQIAGAEPEWVSVFVMNNYGSTRKGRPVYKSYKDRVHCADKVVKPVQGVPIVIGVDVGLDPAAAFTQLTPTGGLIQFDEIVTENTSIEEFCQDHLWPKIRNDYSNFTFYLIIDPAAKNRSQNDKRSAMDVFVRNGLPVQTASSNDPLARTEAVNHFLRKMDGFMLDKGCTISRKGFISEYKYEKTSTLLNSNIWKQKPEKNMYSHIHDAIQYAALYHTGGRNFGGVSKIPAKNSSYRPASHVGY